jgi:hypothetical protein
VADSLGKIARRRVRKRLFGLSLDEASFARRGFHAGEPGARVRLEQIGYTFLTGYHVALGEDDPRALGVRLDAIESDLRGFGFEGAAMALALLDTLTPWNSSRWHRFVSGPAAPHVYMAHVGFGWALARLHRLHPTIERPLARLDPLLRWLALDGYGFHEGYFYWRRYVHGLEVPRGLSGYALNAFDQGLGRSLWFVEGAGVTQIPATIATFPSSRHADLWSGVGLACAYAGGVDSASIHALGAAARPYESHLAQGVAFAAKARLRAGNPVAHTELACRVLCGLSAEEAAGVTDAALEQLPPDGEVPAYEVWRRRIRAEFAKEAVML